ncbi:hypothetical protein ABVT39_001824 [Epinephelus coioides]
MKRQETNKLTGRKKRLGVGEDAQRGAAGFPRLKESKTRIQAAAEPEVSFLSERINPMMSAGGNACWSGQKSDSRKPHDAAGESELYTENSSTGSA